MNLDGLIGTEVTLRGLAEDDAAGAVIQLDTGRCIYLANKGGWGKDRGKPVEVTGTLARRQIGPAMPDPETPVVDDGLATHGMVGKRFILDGATWKFGS